MSASVAARRPGRPAAAILFLAALLAAALGAAAPARGQELQSVFHHGPGAGPYYAGTALALTNAVDRTLPNGVRQIQGHLSYFFAVTVNNERRASCKWRTYTFHDAPSEFQMANRYGAGNNVQRGREISITLNQETIDASQTQVGQDYVRIYTAQNAPRGIHTLVISIAGSERLSTTRPCNNLAGTVHWTITIADQYETINGNDDTALSVFKPDELINAAARTDTGLKYKRSIAACREIDVSLAPGSPDYLEIVRYTSTGSPSAVTALAPVRMEAAASDHVQLFFKPQADTPADATVTVTIQGKATGNAQLCAGFGNSPPDLVVWALTLGTSSWPKQDQHSSSAKQAFSPILVEAADQDPQRNTGLAFHRAPGDCDFVDVRLGTNTPSYLELVRASDTAVVGRGSSFSNVRMDDDHADDNHVRLFFKANMRPAEGTTLNIDLIAEANSTSCASSTVGALTTAWKVTLGSPAGWVRGSSDRTGPTLQHIDTVNENTAVRPNGALTGLRFMRRNSACSDVALSLANFTDRFGLIQHSGLGSGGILENSIGRVRITDNRSDYVWVAFRSGYTWTQETTLTVTLVASAADGCTDANYPNPLTAAYTLEMYANQAVWQEGPAHNVAANQVFGAPEVLASTVEIDTGIKIQRASAGCTVAKVEQHGAVLRQHFQLYRYRGDARTPASQTANIHTLTATMALTGVSDHVRLFIKAGSTLDANTTLNLEISTDHLCPYPIDPRLIPPTADGVTVTVQLTVAAAQWSALSDNALTATSSFDRKHLAVRGGRSIPTDTGVRVHYSSLPCKFVDAELLNATDVLALARHRANGAGVGGPGSSQVNMRMEAGHADDLHLRLKFTDAPPAGALTATISLGANESSCTPVNSNPPPLTLAVTLTATDAAWATLSLNALTPNSSFDRKLIAGTTPVDTAVRLHYSSTACRYTDVALLNATAALELARHAADGTADGAGAASLAAVRMEEDEAEDRHVRLRFKAGESLEAGVITVSLRVGASAASCTPIEFNPAPFTLSFTLTLAEAPWLTLSQNALTPQATYGQSALAGQSPTDTGVRLHYSSTTCRYTDVGLQSGADLLELAQHAADGTAAGAAAASLAAVRMEEGVAADRHVRLRFKAGQSAPDGMLTIAVRVAANAASCTPVDLNPPPFTLAFTVEVLDDLDDAPTISLSATEANLVPGFVLREAAVGIRASATDDDDDDVAFTLRGRTAAGVDVNSLFLLTLSGGSYELRVRQRVSLMAEARYTLVFVATDDVVSDRGVLTAEATVMIQILGRSTEAAPTAALNAGGAAARAIGVTSIDAVLDRPVDVGDGMPSLALLEMLAAKEAELESGDIDLREFLAGQSFALPLNAADAGGGPIGVWFHASSKQIGGEADDVYTEGDVFSSRIGVDARLGTFLFGASYGIHDASSTYAYDADRDEVLGEYELALQIVQPYLSVDLAGMRLAAAAGAGVGEITLTPEGDPVIERDVDYLGYSLGLVQRIDLFAGGELRMRGSYASGDLDVDQPESAASMDSQSSSLRLALAYAHAIEFGTDSSLSPFLEAGYLSLWGDGDIGNSYLVAGGLEYAGGPLRASGSYQEALGDEVTLSGFELSFRFNPRAGGLGLGLDANPGYGLTGAEKMLADLGAGDPLALDADGGGLRGGAGVSYGLAVDGGLLTPYGRWSVDAGRELGLRLRAGERRSWALGYGAAADELKIEYRLGE